MFAFLDKLRKELN